MPFSAPGYPTSSHATSASVTPGVLTKQEYKMFRARAAIARHMCCGASDCLAHILPWLLIRQPSVLGLRL
eukprot:6487061-Amphidinium_carterae.1